jgi:hypothetical protein
MERGASRRCANEQVEHSARAVKHNPAWNEQDRRSLGVLGQAVGLRRQAKPAPVAAAATAG